MAAEAGSYTPETIARRRALAEALYNKKQPPMTHWMQGVAQLGDTFTAGMLEQKNKKEEKEGRAAIADFLLGAQQPAATSSAPQIAPQAPVSTAPTNGKVYANDEPSPLDPPSGQDRDMAIRTILAEAGNQPQVGKEAVAAVLRNRAVAGNFGGDTLPGVIQKPSQFEPWNTPKGRANMAAIDPNSPAYAQAGQALESAYAGQDPTMGATHFYAPKAQAALGRPAPSWDNGKGVDIADHRFFGGSGTPPVMAGASPSDVSAQSRGMPQPAPQGAPATPQAAPGAPQAAPLNDVRAKIAQMLKSDNSYVRQMGTQLANQMIQQQFTTSTPTFGVIGEDDFGKKSYGWINPKNQTATPVQQPAGAGAPTPNAPLTVTGPDGKPIPVPPGVNPKKFRDDVTSATADAMTGKKTEVQANSEQFGNRMEKAEADIANVESEGASAFNRGADAVPFGLGNYLKGETAQKYQQARSQFITSLLRKESGAAIGKEEFTRYDREFFPQPGDTPQVIAQKREARRVAIEAMKKGAGPGYKSPTLPQAPTGSIDDLLKKYGG